MTDGISLDLERLLLEKEFDALDLQEKAWVLTDLTEREYRNMRELLLGTREYFSEGDIVLTPRAGMEEVVKARWQAGGTFGRVERLMMRSVPLWQAAAVALVLCMAVNWGMMRQGFSVNAVPGGTLVADSTVHDSAIHQVIYQDDSLASAACDMIHDLAIHPVSVMFRILSQQRVSLQSPSEIELRKHHRSPKQHAPPLPQPLVHSTPVCWT